MTFYMCHLVVACYLTWAVRGLVFQQIPDAWRSMYCMHVPMPNQTFNIDPFPVELRHTIVESVGGSMRVKHNYTVVNSKFVYEEEVRLVQAARNTQSLTGPANSSTLPRDVPSVLRRVFAQPSHMPRSLFMAALGPPYHHRLRLFATKLLLGLPVNVQVIGGSNVYGHGLPDAYQHTHSMTDLLFLWIRQTFPHPGHVLEKRGIPGVRSWYIGPCTDTFVNQDADLVLADYTINDGPQGGFGPSPVLQHQEMMLRRLLDMPRHPAVMLLHTWTPLKYGSEFWQTGEDNWNIMSAYYQIPWISWRNAVYHRMMANVTGFRYDQIQCDNDHVNFIGHRMWADLIIELIQDLVHSVLPTLLNTNGQLPAINSTNDTIAAANDTTHTLPLPLFPGNGVSFNKCFRTFDFKPFVVDASGFNWTDEGRGKWGFVATAPGSELTLQFSTLCPNSWQATQSIGYLQSYEHNGIMEARCVSGCTCKTGTQNTHNPNDHTSQSTWWDLSRLDFRDPSPACRVAIRVAGNTTSGQHKVKINSLMLRCGQVQ